MKSPILLSAAAVAFGFALGWAVKPTASSPSPPVVAAPATPDAPRRPAAVPDRGAENVLPPPPRPPQPPHEGGIIPPDPLTFHQTMEALAKAREQREIAKMERLAEVLDLTDEQQTALGELLGEAAQLAATAPADGRFLEGAEKMAVLEQAGAGLLASFDELLNPAQRDEFAAMLRREQENRVESAAQRELVELLDRVDLSADQRAAALERSREAAAQSSAPLPPELEVMLDSSVLPLGQYGMSRDAVEIFRAAPPAVSSQDAARQSHFEQRSRDLEARLDRMRDILTPAQLAGYRAAIEEQQVFLEKLGQGGE